jgi:hypothetical protein
VTLLYRSVAVIFGLAFDWASYSRLTSLLGQVYVTKSGYRAFLYPRIFITLIAIVIVFLSMDHGDTNIAFCLLGCGLFLGSNFYAVYRFFRGDKIA